MTVQSSTIGCTDPLGMKSRLISDTQLTASSTFRTWGIDAFTWYPYYARLDKQGKTNAWAAANNSRSEWLQVGLCDDMSSFHKAVLIFYLLLFPFSSKSLGVKDLYLEIIIAIKES